MGTLSFELIYGIMYGEAMETGFDEKENALI